MRVRYRRDAVRNYLVVVTYSNSEEAKKKKEKKGKIASEINWFLNYEITLFRRRKKQEVIKSEVL